MQEKCLDIAERLWFLDSGCSRHMTGDISLFVEFQAKKKGYVTYGDNNLGAILGKGSVGLSFNGAGPSTEDIVKDKEDENESIVKKDAEKEKDESHDQNEKESISNNEELPKAWTNVKDHPIDNIIGDISKGVTTRSKISNLCHHFAFCFTS